MVVCIVCRGKSSGLLASGWRHSCGAIFCRRCAVKFRKAHQLCPACNMPV